MPECLLIVSGKDLDVDAAIRNCALAPCRIWRRGEPRTGRSAQINGNSGVKFTVSNDGDVRAQIREATQFLRYNRSTLRALTSTPGVESAVVDFGWSFDYEQSPAQYRTFAIELLRECVAIGLGIEVSVYASSSAPVDDRSIEQLK